MVGEGKHGLCFEEEAEAGCGAESIGDQCWLLTVVQGAGLGRTGLVLCEMLEEGCLMWEMCFLGGKLMWQGSL